jgi:hypothetical protein
VFYYSKEIDMKLAALVCAFSFSVVCFAASPTIGEAFNTHNSSSEIQLDSGVAVHLSARSTGTIFNDHAILEQGALRLSNFPGYKVQAGPLQIESQSSEAQATIHVDRDSVEIASAGGDLRISNGGVMLTRLSAGTRMFFQNTGATQQPGQTGASPGKLTTSGMKTWAMVVVGVAAAALAIGLTAAAQGKNPF